MLGAAAAAPFVQTPRRAARRTARRTNVVFFLTDDHGAWAAAPWGCEDLHTPNPGRLAAEGTGFSRAT